MHRRLVRWEDSASVVETCDLDALIGAASILGLAMETVPDRDESTPHLTLAPSESGYLLTIGARRVAVPEPDRPAHVLAVAIPWTFHKLSPDPVLHAAGVVVDGEAILFCGRSETGKSTLAITAWQMGLPVMGDDCTVIDPVRALARPFPQGLSLRLPKPVVPKSLAGLAGPDGPCFLGRGLKSDYWLLCGRSAPGIVPYGADYPVRALFLIRRGKSTRLIPIDRRRALGSVLAQTYPGRTVKLAVLPLLETLMGRRRIHELEIGDDDVSGALRLAASPKINPD